MPQTARSTYVLGSSTGNRVEPVLARLVRLRCGDLEDFKAANFTVRLNDLKGGACLVKGDHVFEQPKAVFYNLGDRFRFEIIFETLQSIPRSFWQDDV